MPRTSLDLAEHRFRELFVEVLGRDDASGSCEVPFDGSQSAFDRVIEFHRPLVRLVVKSLNRRFQMDIEDLEQIGIQALIYAARNFDPERGCRFAAYAAYCIWVYCRRIAPGEMQRIRIPPHVFWSCVKLRGKLHQLAAHGKDAADEYLARLRETDPELSQQWERFQRASSCKSLSDPEVPEFRWARSLADPDPDPLTVAIRNELVETVRDCIDLLDDRSSRVVRLRYGIDEQPSSLAQVARILGVTREGVRQIQLRAEEQLKRLIRREMPSLDDAPTNGEDTPTAIDKTTELSAELPAECIAS